MVEIKVGQIPEKISSILHFITGTATLYINDKKAGELKDMRAQGGKFALTGEGLIVGRDGSANMTDDYPGDMPWEFSGGEIKQVVVEVSGEPYLDLEKEAPGYDETRLI